MKAAAALLLPALLLVRASPACAPPRAPAPGGPVEALAGPRRPDDERAWTPAPRSGRLVFLPVRFAAPEGRSLEGLALLDTGANLPAVDPRVVDALELVAEGSTLVEGTGGRVAADTVTVPSLSAAGVALEGVAATVGDLSGLAGPDGLPVDAILGFQLCEGRLLWIDFVGERARFALPGEPRDEERWLAVPWRLDHGIPRVAATLDGVQAPLRIDTGAGLFDSPDVWLNVTTAVWEELRRRTPALAPEGTLSGSGTGGALSLPYARIASARIGPLRIERPWVVVQPAVGYFDRPDAVGFLGNNLLEKHGLVGLDYARGRLLVPRDG